MNSPETKVVNNLEEDSQPTELKVNQERLLVVKDEYKRLCYEIKKKETSLQSTHAKMQQQLKKQWEIISDVKNEKSELCLQIRLQDAHSVSNKAILGELRKVLKEMIRLENLMTKQTEDLKGCMQDIAEVDKKIASKQKEIAKAHRKSCKILEHHQNVSFLENRLNGSLHKYNKLLIANNKLKEDINSLLRTKRTFCKKYSNVKRLLAVGKKSVLEVVNSATTSYQTGESVKYKLNLVNERTEVDQKRLGEKIKELKILVEQDRLLNSFLEFKSREGAGDSDEKKLETRSEQILEQSLQSCHAILEKIQLASGCDDENKICKTFLQKEESNLALFKKVNDMNLEIENLHGEVEAQRKQLESLSSQFTEQNLKDLTVRNDIENFTDKLSVEAEKLEDAYNAKSGEVESIKTALKRIYDLLDKFSNHKVAFTVDDGITDDNVLQYLEALERRLVDIICYDRLVNLKLNVRPLSKSERRRKSEYAIHSRSLASAHRDFSSKTTI